MIKYRNRRQDKHLRLLKKMQRMRDAKERKRLEDNPPIIEPKFLKYFPLELGLKDKITGDIAWVDFKSIRDTVKRLRIVQKYYI